MLESRTPSALRKGVVAPTSLKSIGGPIQAVSHQRVGCMQSLPISGRMASPDGEVTE